jgi:hypothetical protein
MQLLNYGEGEVEEVAYHLLRLHLDVQGLEEQLEDILKKE